MDYAGAFPRGHTGDHDFDAVHADVLGHIWLMAVVQHVGIRLRWLSLGPAPLVGQRHPAGQSLGQGDA
jgi:hypothetical protein